MDVCMKKGFQFSGFTGILLPTGNELHYIGGAEVLPAPLSPEDESAQIERLQNGEDQEARSLLIEHNLRLVVYIAKKFDNTGVGVEDLISIGTIGLIKAIREFDPSRDATFRTFADVCIRNRIRSAVTSASRGKHTPLNDSVPFDSIEAESGSSPEELYISREEETERMEQLTKCLSCLERQVLTLFLQGLSYQEISCHVGRSVKSVDNAVQRIRRKVAPYYGDFSES